MARSPEARYTSAQHLAADLENWLADQPVEAWPEPWTVKMRRWLGRHRTLVVATAATVVVAIFGLITATALLAAANQAERAAKIEATTAIEVTLPTVIEREKAKVRRFVEFLKANPELLRLPHREIYQRFFAESAEPVPLDLPLVEPAAGHSGAVASVNVFGD